MYRSLIKRPWTLNLGVFFSQSMYVKNATDFDFSIILSETKYKKALT